MKTVKSVVIAQLYEYLGIEFIDSIITFDEMMLDRHITILLAAAIEHDLLEDTNMTYNDLLKFNKNFFIGEVKDITEIVYYVTCQLPIS